LFFVLSLALLFPFLALSNSLCRSAAPRLYAVLTGGRTRKQAEKPLSAKTISSELISQQR
jgi:succinoglycan biosynthesis protein ExoH